MMDNIAVILRGHIRTWFHIKERVFDFYSNVAKNVDYYFITWLPSHIHNSPAPLFKSHGQNLVSYLALNHDPDYYTSWLGSSYMAFRMLPYKHARENKIKYDAVIESRPDVLPVLRDGYSFADILKPAANTLYTTNYELQWNFRDLHNDIGIGDWLLMSDSKTYDVMAERLIYENSRGSQISIRAWAEEHNIHVNFLNSFDGIMIRPNIIQINWNTEDLRHILYEKKHQWANLNQPEKISLCNQSNVSCWDYVTGSTTCTI